MKCHLVSLPFLLGLSAMCAAQTPAIQRATEARLEVLRAETSASRQRYEEIEVLGRLLERAVASLTAGPVSSTPLRPLDPSSYPGQANSLEGNFNTIRWATPALAANDFDTWWFSTAFDVPSRRFPGFYLKGQGIIYTRTLSQVPRRIVGDAARPAPREMSAWERMRREMRGERVETERAKAEADVSLADTILRVLAENGAHLTQLSENESVTVALILPGPSTAHPAVSSGQRTTASSATNAPTPSTARVASAPLAPTGEAAANRAEAQKLALLADLHAKQGQPQQALETYRKALELYARTSGAEVKTELEALEVRTKLARALLELGRTEEARKALEDAAASVPRAPKTVTSTQAPATTKEVPIPARLIISVRKSALDQAGKVPFEEFRKAASVEHLTFAPPTAPPKTEPTKP